MYNNHIKAESIKKSQNFKKRFSDFYHSSWGGTPTQISLPMEDVAKIALVIPNNFPWGPLMPNFKSLLSSVWALGGGGYEKAVEHLLYGRNL